MNKWMFQLDDSKSLHKKWLEITKHPFKTGCLGFQVMVFFCSDMYYFHLYMEK